MHDTSFHDHHHAEMPLWLVAALLGGQLILWGTRALVPLPGFRLLEAPTGVRLWRRVAGVVVGLALVACGLVIRG